MSYSKDFKIFCHVKITETNLKYIQEIDRYFEKSFPDQVYVISKPLVGSYEYDYDYGTLIVLSPNHKIVFIDLLNKQDSFDNFVDDFIHDVGSISDTYDYMKHIGRPRKWKDGYTLVKSISEGSITDILDESKVTDPNEKRIIELLISLLIGSINNVDQIGIEYPTSLLEKVKRNIILFDSDQTSFIFSDFNEKIISVQGLSGTGKTELLLHKLKELYLNNDNDRIFFTCHNKALANKLLKRVPEFFNFMKVQKQIQWNERLWVNRAWGSKQDPDSGLYSFLCDFYQVPFQRFSKGIGYEDIFNDMYEYLKKISPENFKPALDYILVDERQDFPDVFFEVCKLVTSKKVYVAGDIFQDIFGNTQDSNLGVDLILNKCYRTDPNTLMFAHGVGLGLFDDRKLNWFSDDYWGKIGYTISRKNNSEVHLKRTPVRRFDELNNTDSTVIVNNTSSSEVIKALKEIKSEHPSVSPGDIAIIILDSNSAIYDYMAQLEFIINSELGLKVNHAIDTKREKDDAIYLTNPNNVKGLEFPFVICITSKILNTYKYRNILYTMMTRSFIKSYLLVNDTNNLKEQIILFTLF